MDRCRMGWVVRVAAAALCWAAAAMYVGSSYAAEPAGWSIPEQLTYSTGAGEYRCAETDTANNLAVDPSGNIHLTWMEDSTGNYEIHYRRKVGPTGPWEAAVQLTDDPGFSSAPSIAADSQGNLHLAWHDLRLDSLDILYRRWDAGTETWGPEEFLTDTWYDVRFPDVVVDGDDGVHVGWQEAIAEGWGIAYRHWDPVAEAWEPLERVYDPPGPEFPGQYPALDVDPDGDVHVAWQGVPEGTTGYDQSINYRRRNSTSDTWDDPVILAGGPDIVAGLPDVICESELLSTVAYCLWVTPTAPALAVDTLDESSDFTERAALPDDMSGSPSMCFDAEGNLHLVREGRGSDGSRQVIYAMRDLGGSWGDPVQLSQDMEMAWKPAVVVTPDDALHVTYQGYRDGYWDVFYCHSVSPTGLAQVAIDIKPGSDRNPVNPKSQGVLPVAVFSSVDFDATDIDPSTVLLAGAPVAQNPDDGGWMIHEGDENGDDLTDVRIHFETEEIDIELLVDGEYAALAGSTYGGIEFLGWDNVTIVPPDLANNNWALEEIAECMEAEIVAGYPDGLYRPAVSVTRDQMAVFISRGVAGGDSAVPEGPEEPTFPDVPTEHWAYRYVEYAAGNDIVTGYGDGSYQPAFPVSRAQMAVFVARGRGWIILGDDMTTAPGLFPDVPAGFWCGTAIEACVGNQVVNGYPDGLYRPATRVTRDQMAVYVARAFGLMP